MAAQRWMSRWTCSVATVLAGAPAVSLLVPAGLGAQASDSFEARVEAIVARPEFARGMFGIEVYSLDDGRVLYERNGTKLFTPGSTTKLLTEGTALALLGADHRFTTRVYRTGPIGSDGTLDGDLVLVASGDPNLSNRIQPDGTLAFENEDHAYDGSPDTRAVPGDPLAVVRDFARQVAAHGVRRVAGRVLVDVSLFPEGTRELGTGVVISPIVVNDNLVDVTIGPGAAEGAPVTMTPSPSTAYVRFVNQATTGAGDAKVDMHFAQDTAGAEGAQTVTVTVTGTMPVGGKPWLFSYAVPQPSRYAAVTFAEALHDVGVEARPAPFGQKVDFKAMAEQYRAENVVAEHTSPPFSEEAKVTLKVSQNLHASMTPYLLGAVLGNEHEDALQKGFDLEHDFLQKLGLDLDQASQGDGAGGAQSAFFTPDFMVHYLAEMANRPDFAFFHASLPVLGTDGTLFNIQTGSPAAGHVHAKTGTFGWYDNLNRRLLLTAKGLAGYVTTADGRHLAFAAYVNRIPIPPDQENGVTVIAGQALGEIAAALYDKPMGDASATRR